MKTFASLFSGFGGADCGAIAAGLQPVWGVEYDAKIAEVGNANLGNHIKVADILDCNPRDFERVDVLHASPPCPNFSVAKAGGVETAHDLAMASKVAEFVTTLQPEIFTLENVPAYRKSRSWHIINEALNDAGYWLNIEICNSADYGVPQTRKRMIVRAIKGGFVPYLPQPEPWVGWFSAIEDLMPALPDTQFAAWQLRRLPEKLRTMLVAQGGYDGTIVSVNDTEPSFTLTANGNQTKLKAVIIDRVNSGHNKSTTRWDNAPVFTITSYDSKHQAPQAFIIDCQNAGNPSPDRERGLTIRYVGEPCFTLTSSMGVKGPTRAFDGGRVVAMTPHCLARFQSFPDWYQLSGRKTLDARGIGNAVPPLMMEKIYRGLLR